MSSLSRADLAHLLAMHGLAERGARSIPARMASTLAAPEHVVIDGTWSAATGTFAGVELQAGPLAPLLQDAMQYRLTAVLLPATATQRAVLWPHHIEALVAGHPVDLQGLRVHSYRAEPRSSAETVGLESWAPSPQTATCDVLGGTHGDTAYLLVLRVLDLRYIGDVHYQVRHAWRRWFLEAHSPSTFCLLEVEPHAATHSIAAFLSHTTLDAQLVALNAQLWQVVNGDHSSIAFTATLLAIRGTELAVLCTGSDRGFCSRADAATATVQPGDRWYVLGATDPQLVAGGAATVEDFVELTHQRGPLVGLHDPHLVAVTLDAVTRHHATTSKHP